MRYSGARMFRMLRKRSQSAESLGGHLRAYSTTSTLDICSLRFTPSKTLPADPNKSRGRGSGQTAFLCCLVAHRSYETRLRFPCLLGIHRLCRTIRHWAQIFVAFCEKVNCEAQERCGPKGFAQASTNSIGKADICIGRTSAGPRYLLCFAISKLFCLGHCSC